MTPDEVRMLDNRYALLFVRGERPVMDFKYDILKHPNVKLTADGGQPPYIHGEPTQAVATLVFDSDIPDNAVSVKAGDIKIDLLGSRVLLKGKILELTAAEYRLICLLVKNANRIITRDIILDELWDSTGDYVDNNTLSVYVRRLREKIETDPSHPEHLLTVRGFGYQWKEVDE